MTEQETAQVYADQLRKLLAPVIELMNQAAGPADQMKINFTIGEKDGRVALIDVSVTKTTKLA